MRAPFASYCSSANWLPAPASVLDDDLVPALDELARARGRQRDPVLLRLDLLGDADSHAADLTSRRRCLSSRQRAILVRIVRRETRHDEADDRGSCCSRLSSARCCCRSRARAPRRSGACGRQGRVQQEAEEVDPRRRAGLHALHVHGRFAPAAPACVQRRDVPLLEGVAAAADEGRAARRHGREGVAARDAQAHRRRPAGRVQGASALHGRGRTSFGLVADKKPGDVNGQRFLEIWFVLSPAGTPIRVRVPSTPAPRRRRAPPARARAARRRPRSRPSAPASTSPG